jgi:uncharacterized membrane protein (UPF0127 family)
MGKLLTLALLLTLWACQAESENPLKKITLLSPKGEIIKTTLAYTEKDSMQGLSGVKPEDFAHDQGMLFFYLADEERHFWMPDTYFDLDLFYLDHELRILDIVRKLPHYIGRSNPQLIPRARSVWSRHVLEMKSGSPIAQKLQAGDQLKWKSSLDLKMTEEKIKTELKK